ncbi:hypothetical protein SAMN04487950_3210 [Halogranum rubrum]|uniref:Uncharacterized protein n=1 Tax=Halogranum rubrum TaxID=553466 RepID=A0A1I4GEK0_9EURY|nr:hypothetical protein SAMN04487950_3210 [Halogranum rubrum]
MADKRLYWLTIVAACTAGSIQAYWVITGERGTLGIVATVAWLVVALTSAWQLRRSSK